MKYVLNNLERTKLSCVGMIRQLVFLSQSSSVSTIELSDGRVGRGGRGANSYDCEKAWFSVNHSVLSDLSLTDIVHKGSGHKVHIYLEYHSVCPLVRIGNPRNHRVHAPCGSGGSQFRRVHTRLRVRGWGSPDSDDWKKKLSILSNLWEWVTKRNA
jgi:hypothetical protein